MPAGDDSQELRGERLNSELVAERERLRSLASSEHDLLEGILLHSPHGIIISDAQGKLIVQNRAADRIWAGRATALSVPEWAQYRAYHPDGRPYEAADWSMARCLSDRQTTETQEIRIQRFDGSYAILLCSSAPILDAAGELVGALSIFADITRSKHLEQANDAAHRRAAFLASAGTVLLSSSRNASETLERLARLAVPDIADWCTIEVPDDGALYIGHVDPAKVEFAREMRRRYPSRPDAPAGVQRVLRGGQAELYSDMTDELFAAAAHDAEHLRLMREFGIRSAMIVPMAVRGRVMGAITLASCNSARRYADDDLEMAKHLAQKAALAVENARLFRAEQYARAATERAADRVQRLQEITADLSRALTSEMVAQVVVDHGAAAVGAVTSAMWSVEPDGIRMRLLRSRNYSLANAGRVAYMQLDDSTPIAVAVRRGEAVFIDARDDYSRLYPESASRLRRFGERIPVSIACLPLSVGARVIGALALMFPDDRTLEIEERTFLRLLAGHCAQGLHRARVYEAEQRARAEMALLYELVDAVSRAATLEEVYEPALQALERALDVQRSSILLYDGDGVLRFKAWHGLSDAYRAAVEASSAWTRDAQDAAPIIVSDVETDPTKAAHLPALRAESIRALAIVPLLHQQKLLGRFVFYSAVPRAFSEDELRMARSMATQVAHAVTRKLADAEIARLFAEAESARAQAETASRLKDEFLAVVSHELRTPMSAILGWSAILKTERRNDTTTLTKAVDVIERNARAQAKIIEDILDVSRIITGKLVIDSRPLSLSALIAEALDVVKASALAKQIALAFVTGDDEPYTIVGDPERLRQVVWNLLSNAIKFTPRGGQVEVAIERKLSSVSVSVYDTGRGIAPEFLPHVFERFRQADSSTTRAQSGLGLGLAIVRHLVELHGGRVDAQSAGVGQGSTFTVHLPVRALSPEAERQADATGRAASGPRARRVTPPMGGRVTLSGVRVLVVDDERDARELLEEMLAARGATVQAAENVASAMAVLPEFRPHVLVSDIGMPEEDGYSLIRRVRGGGQRSIAAIALTAYARSEERKRALDAGYDEHLSKPADANTLSNLIATLSEHARG